MAGPPKGHKPYNTKGEGGRPVIYDDAFLENEANALDEWINDESTIYIGRFAWERGYDSTRLHEFAKKSPRFSRALSRAKQIQEARLVEKGLTGEHKHQMSIFVLSNLDRDNWKQRQETEITGSASLSVNVVHFGLPNTPAQAIDVTPSKELTLQANESE